MCNSSYTGQIRDVDVPLIRVNNLNLKSTKIRLIKIFNQGISGYRRIFNVECYGKFKGIEKNAYY